VAASDVPDFDLTEVRKAAARADGDPYSTGGGLPSAVSSALEEQLRPLFRALDAITVRIDDLERR
jgi:hypothetical protein